MIDRFVPYGTPVLTSSTNWVAPARSARAAAWGV